MSGCMLYSKAMLYVKFYFEKTPPVGVLADFIYIFQRFSMLDAEFV
jgi:hypothetical protein